MHEVLFCPQFCYDKVMRAGFYLYGEQSEAFQARYEMTPESLQHVGVVSKAINRAVTTCR